MRSSGRHGVFRTADGGATWERSSEGTTTNGMADELGTAHFRSITASPVTGKGRPHALRGRRAGCSVPGGGRSEWTEIQTEDATNLGPYAKDRWIRGRHLHQRRVALQQRHSPLDQAQRRDHPLSTHFTRSRLLRLG